MGVLGSLCNEDLRLEVCVNNSFWGMIKELFSYYEILNKNSIRFFLFYRLAIGKIADVFGATSLKALGRAYGRVHGVAEA